MRPRISEETVSTLSHYHGANLDEQINTVLLLKSAVEKDKRKMSDHADKMEKLAANYALDYAQANDKRQMWKLVCLLSLIVNMVLIGVILL